PLLGSMDAVELDRDLLEPLQQKCAPLGTLNLHAADALKFDYCQLCDNQQHKLRIVGNLPYNISSPLLFHLMEQRHCIRDMHFMLQKEVVQRITAQPGSKDYGRLGIMLQYFCEAEMLFSVAPGAFFPPPKVDSAVFRLVPRQTVTCQARDEALLSRVVSMSFSQRRKTIRNNLKGLIDEQVLRELGIDPALRAERLELSQFVQLANWLYDQQKV
ncbi:MAG: 16S rRNA (adenine(1518)-N(6)/adenine(1519)-N(6))-dimethyltransferase RsmA, partial [Thioalkalispiraceae bacterium]